MPKLDDYNKGLIYTSTSGCIDCNKCIHDCPILKSNVYVNVDEDTFSVCVDEKECVLCGKCISTCVHGVRQYKDDCELFLSELGQGKKYSLLVAPSFYLNFPSSHKKIMGYLKSLGVNMFYSVGFGADITTWGYIKFLTENAGKTFVAQPCPVVVELIEKHVPDLIPNIMPIQSPMMCTAIYLKKYRRFADELAFLGPCIAKKVEIASKRGKGLIRCSVTFKSLVSHIESSGVNLDDYEEVSDEMANRMGSLFPKPGGLMENIEFYLGPKLDVIRAEGEKKIYEALKNFHKRQKKGDSRLPVLYDLLNCEKGCCFGTGVDKTDDFGDSIGYETSKLRRKKYLAAQEGTDFSKNSPDEKLKELNEAFRELELRDFMCQYDTDAKVGTQELDDETINEIFNDMLKLDEKERSIDCCACGNDTCLEMAKAIGYGINFKGNCVYYLRSSLSNSIDEIKASKENSQAKSRFLARMSHEIRTPITAVLGISEIKLQDTNLPLDIEEAFAKIYSSANTLLGIVNDLLDLSKIEAGKMELAEAEYEISSLVNDVVQLCFIYIGGKPIELAVDVDENMPAYLEGDELRIKQVLVNFLSNAIKYTGKGNVSLEVGSCDSAVEGTVEIHIKIRDTGYGMTKEQVDELFNEYSRFHEKESRDVQGFGLGMPIALNLLEVMDGTLKIESEVGKGTTAYIVIPQKKARDVKLGKGASQNLKNFNSENRSVSKRLSFSPVPMPYGRVLVVDDIDTNIYVAKGLLNLYKLQVESCDSGIAAINLVKNGQVYDIIFMDQMMPEMNGTEATKVLRGMGYSRPIVALTANALVGVAEEYLKNGFDGFLSKPIQSAHLNGVLTKFIKEKYEKEDPKKISEAESTPREADVPSMDEFLMQPEMQAQIREDFLESQADVIRRVSSAVLIHDIETAHRLVHTLKGVALLLFEEKLADACEVVEKVYKAGKLPEVNAIMNLEKEFAKTYEKIKTEHRMTTVYTQEAGVPHHSALPPQVP